MSQIYTTAIRPKNYGENDTLQYFLTGTAFDGL